MAGGLTHGQRAQARLGRGQAGSLWTLCGGGSEQGLRWRPPARSCVCVSPATLAPVSPLPPTRTARPAWKQRRCQDAQRCTQEATRAAGLTHALQAPLVSRRSGSEPTLFRGPQRHGPQLLRCWLVQVARRTRVRVPISLFPEDILKLKVSPSKLKKKKTKTRLFVTITTHTPLAGEPKAAPGLCPALLRDPCRRIEPPPRPGLSRVPGCVLRSHPEGVKRRW